MTITHLLEVLVRYCKSLEGAKGETIITNYGRMREFIKKLDENEFGKELCNVIDRLVIKQALFTVREREISLKDCTSDWDGKAVAKGYKLAKEIKYLWQERPKSRELTEKMTELADMAFGETSVGTQLCLMGLFFKGAESPDYDLERLEKLYNTMTND